MTCSPGLITAPTGTESPTSSGALPPSHQAVESASSRTIGLLLRFSIQNRRVETSVTLTASYRGASARGGLFGMGS